MFGKASEKKTPSLSLRLRFSKRRDPMRHFCVNLHVFATSCKILQFVVCFCSKLHCFAQVCSFLHFGNFAEDGLTMDG
jgi:hypothetical protein